MSSTNQNPPAVPTAQARTRSELVDELHKVADKGSTEFWHFWWTMTKEERADLMNWSEDVSPIGQRR